MPVVYGVDIPEPPDRGRPRAHRGRPEAPGATPPPGRVQQAPPPPRPAPVPAGGGGDHSELANAVAILVAFGAALLVLAAVLGAAADTTRTFVGSVKRAMDRPEAAAPPVRRGPAREGRAQEGRPTARTQPAASARGASPVAQSPAPPREDPRPSVAAPGEARPVSRREPLASPPAPAPAPREAPATAAPAVVLSQFDQRLDRAESTFVGGRYLAAFEIVRAASDQLRAQAGGSGSAEVARRLTRADELARGIRRACSTELESRRNRGEPPIRCPLGR